MDIQLTPHFKLSEFLRTSVKLSSRSLEAQTTPPFYVVSNLHQLCNSVLEPAREELGMLITVNSGYRSETVNNKVGGVPTSHHLSGYAADITCIDNLALFNILKKLPFDQLIVYGVATRPRFLHVSYRAGQNRKMILYKP